MTRGATGLALAALSRWALRRSTSSSGGRTCSAEVGRGSLKTGEPAVARGSSSVETAVLVSSAEVRVAEARVAEVPAVEDPTAASAALRSARLPGWVVLVSPVGGFPSARSAFAASGLGLSKPGFPPSGFPPTGLSPAGLSPAGSSPPVGVSQENAGSSESPDVSRKGSGCGAALLARAGVSSFTAASLPLSSAPVPVRRHDSFLQTSLPP
jgi:hypothetical protein